MTLRKARRDDKEVTMKIDPVWYKKQVSIYSKDEFPVYDLYAKVLTDILTRAAKLYAPLAIIQARPKSVSSFAEKAARKAFKYDDPVHQITDLCGARVITHTQEQVDGICAFIRENFRIDEANSLDVRMRLSQAEFGYLSVHYIVQFDGEEILGVPIPKEIGDRKAEIQVRTLLQHAWADVTHDRLYKSGFDVPQRFMRQAAMLAAAMESADGSFANFSNEIDAYGGDYAAYMTPEKMSEEIAVLDLILQNEPKASNKPGVALRIGRIAKAAGDYAKAIEVLDEFTDEDSVLQDSIRMELGGALVREHKAQSDSDEYHRGQDLLQQVGRADEEDTPETDPGGKKENITRSSALAALAWSCADIAGQECRARDLYRRVLDLDPSNPYHLASLLECEVFCTRDTEFASAMRPVLLDAIRTCRAHINVGIELPRAYFTIGRLNLLLGRTNGSLAACCRGIAFCRLGNIATMGDLLAAEQRFLQRINPGRDLPPEHKWVQQVLLLGTVLAGCSTAMEEIKSKALRTEAFAPPVLFVAGAAAADAQIEPCREYLAAACRELRGTVVSGGTTAGVPGLVGEIAASLDSEGGRAFTAIGYVAKHLPADAPKDTRYDELIETVGETLGLQEPLQMWIDLLAAGTDPASVRVLGFDGGEIAAFEYRLALAMGATVGIVESSGREAAVLLKDPDWADATNLARLPADPATITAFASVAKSDLDLEQLERAAQVVHARYVEDNKHIKTDPAMLPWDKLAEDLKQSNREQVMAAERTLRGAGYGIRVAAGEVALPEFATEEVERMAELEHGRWNAERLQAGWKYGSMRDTAGKISPYLVPWEDLPESIRDYDRKAVHELPRVLATAGLEVYRL